MPNSPPPIVPFEPFRTKTVEPIVMSSRSERRRWLVETGFNLFALNSTRVMVDLLSDSGTSAMSSRQWGAMMQGDETYAGSTSHARLTEAVQRVTGIAHMIPTAQGRVSERLLVETIIGQPGNPYAGGGNGLIVPNNAHFDTTRFMVEHSGAEAMNLLCPDGLDPFSPAPFKGDMDLQQLEALLTERGDDVPFVMLTVTCNSNGGHPVSLENMRAVRRLCDTHRTLLILDACRFAENAWLIQQREPGQAHRSIREIVREMFDLADGAAMSARKDGLCNTGGLLLLRDAALHARASSLCVLTQGFSMNYGPLAARDLEAMAVGLQEVMDETYLAARAGMIGDVLLSLSAAGVKVVQPAGGHAIFIDAAAFCPHLSRNAAHGVAGHSLACALYEHGGVRATRIGSVLASHNGQPMDLVRLAIPRRTYNRSHMRYVADVIIALKASADAIEPAPLPACAQHALEPELALSR